MEILKEEKNFYNTNLRNLKIEKVNTQALKVENYFKNQKPYNGEELYNDDLFPANFSSISGIDSNGKKKDEFFKYEDGRFNETGIEWLRPAEIFHGKYAIFEGNIESDDIVQGGLSDCYFVSVLASFAKYPQLIIQNFRHLKVQKNGYYEICLRIDGIWKVVIIDDLFPCEKKIPIFAKPHGCEIWVMLLEKAWAKVNGCYSFTEFGYGKESFISLSNFHVETISLETNLSDEAFKLKAQITLEDQYEKFSPQNLKFDTEFEYKERIWKKINNSIKNKSIIVIISRNIGVQEMEFLKPNGILVSHEYSILNTHESIINGNVVRLVEIRNPHGGNEFNGKWSDKSSEWTEETKKIFNNYRDEDQGTFFMSFEDCLENFGYFEICHVFDPLCSKTYQIQKGYENKVLAFDFKIDYDSLVGFTTFTKNRRFHRKIPLNPSQIIEFVLVRLTNDYEFELIRKAKSDDSSEQSWLLSLPKGIYKVFLQLDTNEKFNYDKVRKINFNVTCNNHFFFDFSGEDKEKTILLHDFSLGKFQIPSENYSKIANNHINKKSNLNYDYFFKNLKINFSIFSENIDQRKSYMEYHEQTYPNHIHLLRKLEPLRSYEENNHTKGFDVSFLHEEYGTKYFIGEILIAGMNIIRTGRVAIHDMNRMSSSDEFFVGYYIDGIHEGYTIEYSNDTFQEYYVKDGKVNGEGKIFLRDGKVKLVIYEDFKIVSEKWLDNETHKYLEEFKKMFIQAEIA